MSRLSRHHADDSGSVYISLGRINYNLAGKLLLDGGKNVLNLQRLNSERVPSKRFKIVKMVKTSTAHAK